MGVMKSREMGPQSGSEQMTKPPETGGTPLNLQESREKRLNPEKAQEEERGRLGGILQQLGNKTKARIAMILFMAMTSGALAGSHPEAAAAEKRGPPAAELVEKEKQKSIYSYLRNAQNILADKTLVEEIRKRSTELGVQLRPQIQQEMEGVLTDKEKLPWISENTKGEQQIAIVDTLLFDRRITEAEDEILSISVPLKQGGNLRANFSRHSPDSPIRKSGGTAHVFEDHKLFRPDFQKNPHFYDGAGDLLKPEFALRPKPGSTNQFEFVNPTVAREAGRDLSVHPLLAADVLMTRANDRLALQRIKEVGVAFGIQEIIESVWHALEWDTRFNKYFSEKHPLR